SAGRSARRPAGRSSSAPSGGAPAPPAPPDPRRRRRCTTGTRARAPRRPARACACNPRGAPARRAPPAPRRASFAARTYETSLLLLLAAGGRLARGLLGALARRRLARHVLGGGRGGRQAASGRLPGAEVDGAAVSVVDLPAPA